MTLYTGSGALPKHQYVWVEPNACGEHGWMRGVWFGLTAWPGRAWGCHVMLECGAVYRNLGLHQLSLSPQCVPWEPSDAATWDAYGWQFTTLEYPFLSGMQARVRLQNRSEHDGEYLFTAAPIGDGFSAEPEQSKEFYFIALKNIGRFTAQPTNHVLIKDKSFAEPTWPKFLKRQSGYFSSEEV
jgi:hypothetical protein